LIFLLKNVWWAAEIVKLPIMHFSPAPCYIYPLRQCIFLSTDTLIKNLQPLVHWIWET
jgi:hypothetical protein